MSIPHEWIDNNGDYVRLSTMTRGWVDQATTDNFQEIWRINPDINYGYPYYTGMIDLPIESPMTFEEFVNSLFLTPDGDFNYDFQSKIKRISDKEVQEFVQALSEYLKQKSNAEPPETYLQSEFEGGSFFDYIQTQSDIDVDFSQGFWNESVQTLIDYFNAHFNNQAIEETFNTRNATVVTNGKIPVSETKSYNSNDIKNADAGNIFTEIADNVWAELVRPWYNGDWKTYCAVRENGDEINNFAAASQKNLTFTRDQEENEFENQANNWIRLIMPNNSRRAEVEDLNRNFWVISSVIQGVCAYIWGDYSPIPYLFKGVLNELTQLWENILYLWVGFNLISQKGGRGIKTIIMPLPRTPLQPYRKYDDFITGFPSEETEEQQTEFIIERVKPIIQKYRYTNLCILPYTRTGNYYYNYYKTETYRGAVFYNCRTDKISYVPFEAYLGRVGGNTVDFVPSEFKNYLYAIRETKTYYKWSYPLGNISNIVDNDGNTYTAKRFYGAYRIIPEIKVGYDGSELCIKSLKLTAIDAAAKSLFDTNRKMISYTLKDPIKESSESGRMDRTLETNDSDQLGNFGIYDGTVKEAYYLGELPSCSFLSKNRPYFIYNDSVRVMGEGKLIKIGNYLPKNFYTGQYYKDTDFYGDQVPPDGTGTTDYLLNLTITGGGSTADKNTTKSIYGAFGSANVVAAKNCYFFKPQIDYNNGNPRYSYGCSEETAATMTAQSYRQTGIDVISDHIKKVSAPTTITYYVAGVGIQPWHNKPQNDTFQGYWITTMLTHMYRYVPNAYKKYISDEELATSYPVTDINGTEIGKLQVLGAINKREAAFSVRGDGDVDSTFTRYHNLTTWRLPQLIPEKRAQGYIILQEQATNQLYFIDPDESPELNAIFEQQGGAAVAQEINDNYATYADQLITEDNFRFELQNPSGRWCVFDGNTNTGYLSNKKGDIYKNQNDRREVAYTNFNFSNGNLALASPTQGRLKNATGADSWFNCNASYILPNGGFGDDMKFNW